tara:strand:- start:484 stop:807 length:324 start_codon:yes stop_codon:yes gene_type:complete
MEELIRLDNKWVTLGDWLKETAEHYRKEEEREAKVKEVKVNVVEVDGCKDLGDIVDGFRGDEPRPIEYKLSREWQDRVTLSEDLGSLRSVLGWTLYREWIKETVTGQ